MLLLFLCTASCCSQDEIDETEKMGKAILEELEEKTQLEQEEILQKVAEVCGMSWRRGSVCGSCETSQGFLDVAHQQ